MPDAARAPLDLDVCANEPIRTPGSIQPHGYLFVLNENDLTVVSVSQNTADALDLPAAALLGRPITDLLVSTTGDDLGTALRSRDGETPIHVRLQRSTPALEWAGLVHQAEGVLLLELGQLMSAEDAERLFGQIRVGIRDIRKSRSVAGACDALAAEIRRITGFDRVMVYRFDPEWHGEVIAEARADDARSYLGHSFPASDIPAQARALYITDRVRLIPDAACTPSPMIPALLPATGLPIDLSGVTLRSVSPVHLEYLANMGVVASMSVSIVRDDRLWALVACHHPSPRTLPFRVLQGCDLLAQVATWLLDAQERSASTACLAVVRHLEANVTSGLDDAQDFLDRLAPLTPTLLGLTQSQGLAICEGQAVWAVGEVPTDEQVRTLVSWLESTGEERVVTDRLSTLFPAADVYRARASGIAAEKSGDGWRIWFRAEWAHATTWAGEPGKMTGPTGRLHPRMSFASWREEVRGRSRPWTASDLFAVGEVRALVLRVELNDRIRQDFQRRKQESVGQVAGGLAHELNSLLQPIIGMAQMAQEDHPDDAELNDVLAVILDSAGRAARLVQAMQLSARGSSSERRHVSLAAAVERELEVLRPVLPPGIVLDCRSDAADCMVRVPAGELGQIIKNLVENATDALGGQGTLTISLGAVDVGDSQSARLCVPAGHYARILISDDGPGIAPVLLHRVFDPFFTTKDIGKGIGLGLSIVQGIARSCGGAAAVRNRPEGGAVFEIILPCFAEPAVVNRRRRAGDGAGGRRGLSDTE